MQRSWWSRALGLISLLLAAPACHWVLPLERQESIGDSAIARDADSAAVGDLDRDRPPTPERDPDGGVVPKPDATPVVTLCVPEGCEGCCTEDGKCAGGNEPQACGQGGETCAGCLQGQVCHQGSCCAPSCDDKCSGASDECGGICNTLLPCIGCCDKSGYCQPGTAASACGSGGNACADCAPGFCKSHECAGACVACAGCCSDGRCLAGDDNQACGMGGALCHECLSGTSCQSGKCQ